MSVPQKPKNNKKTWDDLSETFEKKALEVEQELDEAGYAGQGHTSGAESFYGDHFGFGGEKQLAAGLAEPVKKLKKQRDKEAVFNVASQQRINRGYPAPQSVTGFPGGESTGIRSGERYPNSIPDVALPVELVKQLLNREPEEEYFGFDDSSEEEPEQDLEELEEQAAQGPQRGVASDQNYRDLPGWPRHNTIEKPGNFIPKVDGDKDGDGEEDDYLTDAEYVNDVLRLNGIGVKPGHMKKLFGQEELEESALHERTLFHGTSNDHLESVKKYGLSGDLGDFVKDSYGISLPEEWDEDEIEDRLGGVTFAADKSNIDAAVGAMRYHVGKKIGKSLRDVDENDLRKHGMLVIIRDVEEPRPVKYPEDVEEDEWYHRPKDDEDYYGAYPMAVEPGDWFIKGGAGIDDVLTGNKMIQFLRRVGGLEHIESDERRELIKLAVAYHGQDQRDAIVKKVRAIPAEKLSQHLRTYRDLASDVLAQQRKERYGGQKHKGQQLSFDFGESKYRLSKVFKETMAYVSPSYDPEPDRGTERYKRGDWNEVPQGDDWLIHHVDYSGGHAGKEAAEESPGGQSYGQIGAPKDFVPDDWEQRHPKTKEEPMDPDELKEIIQLVVNEALEEIVDEAYTGTKDKTGEGEPKGGSAAFEKNRKEVLAQDEENKPKGIDDLKNYHMDK